MAPSRRDAAMDAELQEVWSASEGEDRVDEPDMDVEDHEYRPSKEKQSRVHVQHAQRAKTRGASGIVMQKQDHDNASPDRPGVSRGRSGQHQLPTPIKSPQGSSSTVLHSPKTPTPAQPNKRRVRLHLPSERPSAKRLKSNDSDAVDVDDNPDVDNLADRSPSRDDNEQFDDADNLMTESTPTQEGFVDDEAVESDHSQYSNGGSPSPRRPAGRRSGSRVLRFDDSDLGTVDEADHGEQADEDLDRYDYDDGWLVPDEREGSVVEGEEDTPRRSAPVTAGRSNPARVDSQSRSSRTPSHSQPRQKRGEDSQSTGPSPATTPQRSERSGRSSSGQADVVPSSRRRPPPKRSEGKEDKEYIDVDDDLEHTPAAARSSKANGSQARSAGPGTNATPIETRPTSTPKPSRNSSSKGKEKAVNSPDADSSQSAQTRTSQSSKGGTSTSAQGKAPSTPSKSSAGPSRSREDTGRVRRRIADVISPEQVREKYPERETIKASYTVPSLPSKCEVTDPKLFDEVLAGDYSLLARNIPLRKGHFEPWRTSQATSFFAYSEWTLQCPELDSEQALEIIRFQRSGRYINPARSDPRDIVMKLVSSRPIRYHFQTKDTKEDVTFVVVASCTETWLREPRDSAYPAKVVKALGLSQEIQRIYGYFCMASNQKKLHAQLFEGSIDYSTQTDYGSSGAMSESVDNYFLTINDTIPVYDGRNTYFDVTADLAYLKELLPLYEDEIPPHSCVVIGHTVTCYKRRAGCWGVGFNLKWVVVLATP